uniref:Uncharacterized protein n=1 Tax=Anguilla anguilla TaxID=7936 RepID=A0A0E9SFJ7_ANGAN
MKREERIGRYRHMGEDRGEREGEEMKGRYRQ